MQPTGSLFWAASVMPWQTQDNRAARTETRSLFAYGSKATPNTLRGYLALARVLILWYDRFFGVVVQRKNNSFISYE